PGVAAEVQAAVPGVDHHRPTLVVGGGVLAEDVVGEDGVRAGAGARGVSRADLDRATLTVTRVADELVAADSVMARGAVAPDEECATGGIAVVVLEGIGHEGPVVVARAQREGAAGALVFVGAVLEELVVLGGHVVRIARSAGAVAGTGDADAAAHDAGEVGLADVAQRRGGAAEHQPGVVVANRNRAAGVLGGVALQRVAGDDQVPHRRVGPDRATRSGVALVSARARTGAAVLGRRD